MNAEMAFALGVLAGLAGFPVLLVVGYWTGRLLFGRPRESQDHFFSKRKG